ncbi:microcystin-dependent protein [Caulobacter sp. AP07]|uniref:phage tail protein n=1 Tax=Caulobacter sp. AP07 TaxID=1144304 RepID=UPI000271DEB4|nr:tail fiber protein [Caulobacter sp. AP07]EJL33131.1 microcystin-dependent protein [Caulobacter sp. AP07]
MGTPFMGELRIMSFNFAPQGWALCNGQFLPINQNQALFSLLGTTYGGNGQTTFALPDLRGRIPLHMGDGFVLGQASGQASHTLIQSEMPTHFHVMRGDGTTAAASNVGTPVANMSFGQTTGAPASGAAFAYNMYATAPTNATTLHPASVSNTGGSQPHENRQPFLVLEICIALSGAYPSRN